MQVVVTSLSKLGELQERSEGTLFEGMTVAAVVVVVFAGAAVVGQMQMKLVVEQAVTPGP